jgi:hypothetical protein
MCPLFHKGDTHLCVPFFIRRPISHAVYQGFEAFVGIADGEIIHGRLPKKAARIVRQWTLDHHDELMANWARGTALEPMEMIPGADVDD